MKKYFKREIINIESLNQIDFQKEIVEDIGGIASKRGSDELSEVTSAAVFIWLDVQEIFFSELEKATESYVKSNIIRVLQYFYSRWLYLHAAFYDMNYSRAEEPLDFKKSLKGDDFWKKVRKFLKGSGRLKKSKLPFSMLQDLKEMFERREDERRELTKTNKDEE